MSFSLDQLNVLRFSISWSRIFPEGKSSSTPNPKGVYHYHDVLSEMKSKNIEPIVSLILKQTALVCSTHLV